MTPPELNTGDSTVQTKVLNLLQACIECGVDGFCFDNAKHIELPSDDSSFASQFWPTVIGGAKDYASTQGFEEPFFYGEILGAAGPNFSISNYTDYMAVTDNVTGDRALDSAFWTDASGLADDTYIKGAAADKSVLSVESYETYMGNAGTCTNSNTKDIPYDVLNLAWAIVGARSLYSAPVPSPTPVPTPVLTPVPSSGPGPATYTIYAINNANWSKVIVHYWGDGETDWPGNLMTSISGNKVYTCDISKNVSGICFTSGASSSTKQTGDITSGIYDGAVWIIGSASSNNYPLSVAPDYYLAGTMNSWTNDNSYRFSIIASDEGRLEYKLSGVQLAANAEFKVRSSADSWYPGGNNHTVSAAGVYDIYFRPNGDTVLGTDTVLYGESPAFTGETPTKAPDADKVYTFDGWKRAGDDTLYTDSFPAVTGDVTYSAQFDGALRNYTVTAPGSIPGGEVTADSAQAAADATVTITVVPSAGFALTGLSYAYTPEGGVETTADISFAKDETTGNYTGSFTMPASDVTVTAVFLPAAESVSNIDAGGAAKTATAYPLTAGVTTLPGGWYVVDGEISLSRTLEFTGDANLILADGKSLTLTTGDDYGIYTEDCSLTVYGQQNGTGTLDVKADSIAINSEGGNVNLHGGTVLAGYTGNGNYAGIQVEDGDLSITGGTVTATGTDLSYGIEVSSGNISITGGHVTISGGYAGISNTPENDPVTLTLGCGTSGDYIQIGGELDVGTGASVQVASGQTLCDGAGNAYSGELTGDEIAALAGQTLRRGWTVTFDNTGGSAVPAQTVAWGDTATPPADPAKEGYRFDGWYQVLDDQGTLADTAFDFEHTPIDADITLKAAFTQTGPVISGYDLVLDGTLGLRFYMALPQGFDPSGAYMEFDIKGEKQRVDYGDATTIDDCRVFTCAVRAHQMADPITATFHYGDGQTVTKAWSIKQYLDKFSNDGSSTGNLVAATLNYGHYVQPYMNEVHGWTFGDGKDHELMPGASEISPRNNASAFVHTWEERNTEHIKSAQYFLTLNASTTLNIQVQLKDAPTSVSASVDGNSWNAEKIDNNTYMIAIPNIASNNLSKPYRVLLTVDGNVVFELKVSALSYVNTVLRSDRASNTERLALTALYDYYQAAKAYKPD